jgi:hypothetical protein
MQFLTPKENLQVPAHAPGALSRCVVRGEVSPIFLRGSRVGESHLLLTEAYFHERLTETVRRSARNLAPIGFTSLPSS